MPKESELPKDPEPQRKYEIGEDFFIVTDSDVAAWAERERQRRRKWIEGPTEREKRAWAQAEHRRRLREEHEQLLDTEEDTDPDLEEGRRVADRLRNEGTLALLGAVNWLSKSPYRYLGHLLREGAEWEEEHRMPLRKRRRVRFEEE
jgi:hypothetical protein